MHVWPAIDLLDGAAVRLHQGNYDEVTVYERDPGAIAARFRGRSPRLHVVDLEGARRGAPSQVDAVRELVAQFGAGVQVGGGIRTVDAAARYIEAGAARIVLGTAAVKTPAVVREAATRWPGVIVIAVDAKNGFVATEGWTEMSTRTAADVVRDFADLDLAGVLYTDVARDGTGRGPNVEATARLARETGAKVLASGGVGSLDHLRALAAHPQIDGVVVGKALLDGVFTLEDAIAAAT
jgi:phosphoribosylformimino-5-aminoimidazole carboxamide ribotide isomerase